jgi:hypothetical protein
MIWKLKPDYSMKRMFSAKIAGCNQNVSRIADQSADQPSRINPFNPNQPFEETITHLI